MKTEKPKQITTKSGFSFTPPEHILDDWDFLSALSHMASKNLTDAEVVNEYFNIVNLLLGEDDLERLKNHVREKNGYVSFVAIRLEIEDAITKLKEIEGNSSSSPE